MIRMTINQKQLAAMRDKLAKNIKYAYVSTLTWAARETKEDMVAGLPMFFTLRNNYLKGGFRSTRADFNKAIPESEVGTIKPASGPAFMRDHAIGGQRDVKGEAAVPIYARRNKQMQTRKPVWPGSILAKEGDGTEKRWVDGEGATKKARRDSSTLQNVPRKKNRVFVMKSRSGREFLVQRLSTGSRARLRFWYVFVKAVKIKKDWPFEQYIRTAIHHFHLRFPQAMKENL